MQYVGTGCACLCIFVYLSDDFLQQFVKVLVTKVSSAVSLEACSQQVVQQTHVLSELSYRNLVLYLIEPLAQ